MANTPSRRDVLIGSASIAAALALGGSASAATQSQRRRGRPGPNERVRFATVGAGGKGESNTADAARFGDIVGIADVDANTRGRALAQYPNASTFADYRVMLEALEDQIDAVIVSTPDHTHAVAAAMAIRMGKAVYVEKPLTRTIWEARELARLCRRHRVASQMGNQFTSSSDLRRVAAILRGGKLGAVKEVHCWTNRAGGWWPQGTARPAAKAQPRHVNFDLWLGPSPDRPYADGYHPFAWRGYWDFGSGALGDIGCHCMNLPFMALDLRNPLSVQAETSGNNRETFPAWSIVRYEFGATRERAALPLTWYDGGKLPPESLAPGVKYDGNGCLIVCDGGTLYMPGEYGGGGRLLSGEPLPEAEFEASPGHMAELVEAIKGGKPPKSNIPDYAGPLTETVLLGNLAVWADGEKVEWDARNLKAKGTDAFDSLIRPAFRPGWSL